MPPNPNPEQEDTGDKLRESSRSYLKYSGMAIQMGIIILLFTYGGKRLDAYMANPKPYFTVAGALLGIFGALYLTLKDIIRNK